MAQGLKPSDNPVKVREFETRLLLVVSLVYCFHFGVSLFFFNYTPMEVVSPVGMLVYTAVYTLATDGAVLIHPRRTDVCFNVGC